MLHAHCDDRGCGYRASSWANEPDDQRRPELRANVAAPVDGRRLGEILDPGREDPGSGEAAHEADELLDLRAVRIGLDRGDEGSVLREVADGVVERPDSRVLVPATAGEEDA